MRFPIGFLAAALIAAPSLMADTASISASDDSFVDQDQPTALHGMDAILRVKTKRTGGGTGQNNRTLLKFDLSGIPAGSTIHGATLVLNLESGAGLARTHELHFSSADAWLEQTVNWNTQPGLTSLLDSISTGTTTSSSLGSPVLLSWGANGPNGPSGSNSEALTARVTLEHAGDQTLTLLIKDATESAGTSNREGVYTSDESLTGNPKPALIVDYTPPVSCTEATLDLEAFNLSSPGPLELNTPYCFNIEFKVTAGCMDLSSIKTQGGIGGNLTVANILASVGDVEVRTQKGKGANNVLTWTITPEDGGLGQGDDASLTATVCTGSNPAGKQEFTSCGVKPITGNWSSTAVVAEDGSIISSTPEKTDRLEVEVACP